MRLSARPGVWHWQSPHRGIRRRAVVAAATCRRTRSSGDRRLLCDPSSVSASSASVGPPRPDRTTTRRRPRARPEARTARRWRSAADMFERVELEEPRKALEDAGATTEVVSIHDGEIQGFDHFDAGAKLKVDKTVEEAAADDYDALLIPGGVGNPDQLRGDENAVAFVRAFAESKQADRGRSATARGCSSGRRRARPHAHVVADARDRHPNAGGDLGRPGGRRRRRDRHEPQAGRHPGLQREDDRGVRRGPARERRALSEPARGTAARARNALRLCRFAVAVAQLVEPRVVVPVVAGSSPVRHPLGRGKSDAKGRVRGPSRVAAKERRLPPGALP